jgi:hypothetical protein
MNACTRRVAAPDVTEDAPSLTRARNWRPDQEVVRLRSVSVDEVAPAKSVPSVTGVQVMPSTDVSHAWLAIVADDVATVVNTAVSPGCTVTESGVVVERPELVIVSTPSTRVSA